MIKNIAIIPARLGSKRIKEKNIKTFYSKPIIQWTYEILKKSKLFSKIYLSTESEKIIKICKKFGFRSIIKRPKILAGGKTTIKAVMIHALKELNKSHNFNNVCCVFPCSPFLSIQNLIKAEKIIKKKDNYLVHPVTKFRHPPERSLILNKKNEISVVNENLMQKMTQEFKTKYHDVGQFYFSNQKVWLKKPNDIIRVGIELKPWEAIDIDNVDDWKFAEKLFKNYRF